MKYEAPRASVARKITLSREKINDSQKPRGEILPASLLAAIAFNRPDERDGFEITTTPSGVVLLTSFLATHSSLLNHG
jgi:hypothetical protein